MGVSRRSTVPVTCPRCQHEGPAFLYLLGKWSRCKQCGHGFAIPNTVRMGCPHCQALLRVPAEMIGRDVACKFCDEPFRADPVRAERSRPGPEDLRSPERSASLEGDLFRFLGEQEAFRGELGRFREEIDELSRRERREIQEIQTRVDRLAAVRSAFAREADQPDRLAKPTTPHIAPRSSMAKHLGQAHGHAWTAAPANGRTHRGAAAAKPRPAPVDAALREVTERLVSCEAMTDRLIARLRSTQEQRAEDRATFARVIERLHDELARARDQFGTNPADPVSTTERDDPEGGKLDAIAMTTCLPDSGVA